MRPLSSSFYMVWKSSHQPTLVWNNQVVDHVLLLGWTGMLQLKADWMKVGRPLFSSFLSSSLRPSVLTVCVWGGVGLTLTEFFPQVESPFRVNHLPWHFPFLVSQRNKHSTYTTYLLPPVGVDRASSWNRCLHISWCKIGQTSSTSKGEISWWPPSSLTSEANTFSAKLRVASSIPKRRFHVLVFKHFLRSHPRVSATHKAQC